MKTLLGFFEHLIVALIWVAAISAGAVVGGERLLRAWTDGQTAIAVSAARAGALSADAGAAGRQAAACGRELTIRMTAERQIDAMKAAPPQPGGIFDSDAIGKVFGDGR
jgi:hypothetical protein